MNREDIKNYLLQNPIDREGRSPYDDAAKSLGVDREVVRSVWRTLRRGGVVENAAYKATDLAVSVNSFAQAGDTAILTNSSNREIRNEKDLAEECNIDLKEWEIKEWSCRRTDAYIKGQNGEQVSQPKFSLSAKMVKRKVETDLNLQKELILKELFEKSPKVSKYESKDLKDEKYLYELSLFDVHFGKLSWGEEVGEDYDIKIAEERFNTAITELLSMVKLNQIERILFPIGNDLVNIDSRRNETTAGTRQDSDSRFFKIIKTVKRVLIDNINKLSKIAPVDVIIVQGNHDNEAMFMLGEMLDAYYHNDENINIDNSPKQRKYYQYGLNGFQYTHGNEEAHKDLGMIFAAEEAQLWAATEFRTCKVGHFHKSKKLNYLSVDEFQGFQLMVLPSLSGTCAWTKSKGYNSIKAAKGFLYDFNKGMKAEFTHIVK